MKFKRQFILFVGIISIAIILAAGVGFASDDVELKEYDFDSYFKMNVPKDVNFEISDDGGNTSGNITLLKTYTDNNTKINVVYAQTKDNGKADLVSYYEDMAKNDKGVNITVVNNTTVIHFNDENTIGEIEYHDMAIAGDDTQYILIQCDDADLMNAMAGSIKLK